MTTAGLRCAAWQPSALSRKPGPRLRHRCRSAGSSRAVSLRRAVGRLAEGPDFDDYASGIRPVRRAGAAAAERPTARAARKGDGLMGSEWTWRAVLVTTLAAMALVLIVSVWAYLGDADGSIAVARDRSLEPVVPMGALTVAPDGGLCDPGQVRIPPEDDCVQAYVPLVGYLWWFGLVGPMFVFFMGLAIAYYIALERPARMAQAAVLGDRRDGEAQRMDATCSEWIGEPCGYRLRWHGRGLVRHPAGRSAGDRPRRSRRRSGRSRHVLVSAVTPNALLVPVVVFLPALFEEFAWRGFAVEVMIERGSGFARAALGVGLVFTAIHLPLYLPGQLYDYLPVWPGIVFLLGGGGAADLDLPRQRPQFLARGGLPRSAQRDGAAPLGRGRRLGMASAGHRDRVGTHMASTS